MNKQISKNETEFYKLTLNCIFVIFALGINTEMNNCLKEHKH
jgi:hypothetical protein